MVGLDNPEEIKRDFQSDDTNEVIQTHLKRDPTLDIQDRSKETEPSGILERETELEFVKLSTKKLLLIGSATTIVWFQGVAYICGTGYLLPVIQKEFQISLGDVQWVTAAFNITWGCFALVAGRVGDIYGLDRTFIFGLSFYAIWVLIGGFMPNIIGLSMTQSLSGIGFAIASPAAAAMIGTYFPSGKPKTIAFSVMAGAGAIGAGLGWLLGGLFTVSSPYTWRCLMFLCSSLTLYPITIAILVFPRSPGHPRDKKVDWIGASMITSAQVLLGLSLTFPVATKKGWKAPYIPVLFILSAILFISFIFRQFYLDKRETNPAYPPPLTPARLFGHRRPMVVIYLSTFFVWMGSDSLGVTASYFYEDVLGLSGWQAGLRVLPSVAGGVMGSIMVGILLHYLPSRAVLVLTDCIGGSAGIIFAARPMNRAYWKADLWAWLTTSVASDGADQGVANALLVSCMRFGAMMGLALSTITREGVQHSKEASFRHSLGLDSTTLLDWTMEQIAEWEGVKSAFFFCGASVLTAAAIVGIGLKGWYVVGRPTSNEVIGPTSGTSSASSQKLKMGTSEVKV
ncbi:hypothetical protein M231_07277 [Tremella mesenterica]|uniref:Major facilitator superfamily (MFS) profile domain-containing protein n=1 Tax=Tremella mesenterica TaxID=5217 RepID=A0A4Q1BEF1_TREME|nr:hypothetical protein M231_07277 [Tremella mesenterica]